MAYEDKALFTLALELSLGIKSSSLDILLDSPTSALVPWIEVSLSLPHSLFVKEIGGLVGPDIENLDGAVFKATNNEVGLL